MMIEIALLQRMSLFLAHPVYALSVVLFSLILFTGLGSMPSACVLSKQAWSPPGACVRIYFAVLVARAPGGYRSRGPTHRGLCILVLMPAGFLMGFGFPRARGYLGDQNGFPAMTLGRQRHRWRYERCIVASIAFSIDTTLQIGAACYLLVTAPAVC